MEKIIALNVDMSSSKNLLNLSFLTTSQTDFEQHLRRLLTVDNSADQTIQTTVCNVIATMRQQGVAALLDYTQRWDGVVATTLADLRITQDECQAALRSLSPEMRDALQQAADRILWYHQEQAKHLREFNIQDAWGNSVGQVIRPLSSVGIYVPGGKAAYPSSVLMNAIPARVAGVGKIIMVVPTPQGVRNPYVLAAAAVAQVDEVWAIGGAQAVAALAYGVEGLTMVDKIVGPGNAYVAEAKRQVFGQVGIDMVAGPSEILIVSDGSVNPEWLAWDLCAQAEHDELAQAIVVSPDRDHLLKIHTALNTIVTDLPRRDIAVTSLTQRGALIHAQGGMAEAIALANRIAPEHLELAMDVSMARHYLPQISAAGAVFMGAYSSEALGDYCAGPNHVLPTSGSARFASPLSVYDFQKRMSVLEISQQGAQQLGSVAGILGEGEGLQAHARSALIRGNRSF